MHVIKVEEDGYGVTVTCTCGWKEYLEAFVGGDADHLGVRDVPAIRLLRTRAWRMAQQHVNGAKL